MNDRATVLLLSAAGLALALPAHAWAQNMSYDGSASVQSQRGGDDAEASGDEEDASPRRSGRHGRGQGGRRVEITPYLEAMQVANAQLSPGSDVLTYTSLAAGVEASIQGRNTQASVSARYERRFGYGKTADADTISGAARVSAALVPHTLSIEAGAMAARTQIENNGSVVLGAPVTGNSSTQVYSAYAGPSLTTHAGDVAITGAYRLGYTKVGTDNGIVTAPGGPAVDVFDHSIVHDAELHAGVKPGDVLPVGVGVGAGFYQEDIANLDQRVSDQHARLDLALPVGQDVQLVGGVGYEKVQVSARDAVRDGSGNPVVGSNGRYVTDKSVPRTMAYDTSGLIWDAGVMWRPSRRTALEAHVGRRYGSTTYYGSFAYKPNTRSSLNVSVYDGISGFGGKMNRALAGMPTNFQAARNPFSGDINTCLVTLEQGNCLNGALASVRSSTFRSQGVMASYGVELGNLQAGVGAGYDRRKFIAAPGTVLASANGVVDSNVWVSGYLNGRIDDKSSFATNVWTNWFSSGFAANGDGTAIGANASYYRNLTSKLSATAAVGIDGINREALQDVWNASALVGLRYSF